jgi:regulator of nucleoside diphosphate kinase
MKYQFNEADIVLSASDAEALMLMLGEYSRGARSGDDTLANLVEVVQVADIVASGPELDDRITMNACISYVEAGKVGRELMLTWPNAAVPEQGRVSVLSPMGIAMLGRRVGDQVLVALPNGARRQLTITGVRAAQAEELLATVD